MKYLTGQTVRLFIFSVLLISTFTGCARIWDASFSSTAPAPRLFRLASSLSSSSVSPSAGALSGSTLVSINGSGFRTGATVSLGQNLCKEVKVDSSSKITCITPAHAAGAVSVTVTNRDKQFAAEANAFTYEAAPTVTAVNPSSGTPFGNTLVEITGSGFLAQAYVDFDGSLCNNIVVNSPTLITCKTSAHPLGPVTVTVTNFDAQVGDLDSGYIYAMPTVVSLSVTAAITSIPKGLTQQLIATGTMSDGSTQDYTESVNWISSNPAVASIDSSGLATGVGAGTSQIRAKLGSITSPALTLTVTAPQLVSIAVTPNAPSIAKGNKQVFVATGTYTDNSTLDISTTATWNSSNIGCATISSLGLATGIDLGTSQITAKIGSITSPAATLTVTSPILSALSVQPSSASIAKGLTQLFTVTGTMSDGSPYTGTVTWSSATPAVATISPLGLATGAGVGSSQIMAKVGSITSPTVTLTVTEPILSALSVQPSSASIPKEQTQQFTVIGIMSDGSSYAASVTWSSGTPSVASINSSGLATGVGVGTSNITASAQGISSVAAILTVTPAAARLNFGLASYSTQATVGNSSQLNVTLIYSGGVGASGLSYSVKDTGAIISDTAFTWTPCAEPVTSNCSLTITYQPTTVGSVTATLEIDYADGTGSIQTIATTINANALSPALLSLSPSPLDFASASPVAGGSYNLTLTLTNLGGSPAGSLSPSQLPSAPFQFKGGSYPGTGGSCQNLIAANGNCTVIVTFNPPASDNQLHTQTIGFQYNDQTGKTSPSSASVQLRGQAQTAATLTANPASYDFTPEKVRIPSNSSKHIFTLSNTGGVSAHIQSITSSPSPSGNTPFTIASNTCGSSVTAGSQCILEVTFQPFDFTNLYSFLVTITYNDGANTHTVSFTAMGQGMAPYYHQIFATSQTFDSNLLSGSTSHPAAFLEPYSGADTRCQEAAASNPSLSSGSYRALISLNSAGYFGVFGGGMPANRKIIVRGPVYNLHGDMVASSPAAFWSQTGGIQNPVKYDENSQPIAGSNFAWTGADINGNAKATGVNGINNICAGWADNAGGSTVGFPNYGEYGNVMSTALLDAGQQRCLTTQPHLHLYCISQTPALKTFTATTGVDPKEIVLTFQYPDDPSDYDHIKILRTPSAIASASYRLGSASSYPAGPQVPDVGCADASTVVTTLTAPFGATQTLVDRTSAAGGGFAYRACIYDSAGNLAHSNHYVLNVASGTAPFNPASPDLLYLNAANIDGTGQTGSISSRTDTTWKDLSGSGNDAAIVNLNVDPVQSGWDGNGTGDNPYRLKYYVTDPIPYGGGPKTQVTLTGIGMMAPASTPPLTAMTIVMWFNPTQLLTTRQGAALANFGKFEDTWQHGQLWLQMDFENADDPLLASWGGSGYCNWISNQNVYFGIHEVATAIIPGNWYQIALVSQNSKTSYYLNGQLIGVTIGTEQYAGLFGAITGDGAVASLRAYSGPATAAQILSLYENEVAGFRPSSTPALTIDAVTPAIANASGGTQIVLEGAGIGNANQYLIGNMPVDPASVTRISDSAVQFLSPAGIAGSIVDVTVVSGGSSVTAPHAFTFLADSSTLNVANLVLDLEAHNIDGKGGLGSLTTAVPWRSLSSKVALSNSFTANYNLQWPRPSGTGTPTDPYRMTFNEDGYSREVYTLDATTQGGAAYEIWFRAASTTGIAGIFQTGCDLNNGSRYAGATTFASINSGKLCLAYNAPEAKKTSGDICQAISKNTWYHAVISNNGTTTNYYLNGQLINTVSGGREIPNDFCLGYSFELLNTAVDGCTHPAYVNYSPTYFQGEVAKFRMYNAPLGNSDVSNLYNTQKAMFNLP